jgi:hypothetical protein
VLRFPRRPRTIATGVLVLLAFLAVPARADVEGIRLAYSAYAGCPDEDRFLQGVTARTEKIRRAAEGAAARTFVVAVTRETRTIRGVLSITGLDGAVSRREVTGDSCDEVVSALALITALAVDPLAATAPELAPPVTEPPSSPAAGGPSTNPPADAAVPTGPPVDRVAPSAPHPSVSPEPRSADRLPAAASAPATPGPTHRVRWAVGVQWDALGGLVPGWGIGGGAFVDATGPARGPLVPSFRASVSALSTRVAFAGAVGAELEWFVATLETCPLRLAATSEMGVSLCAALDAGALRSTGSGLQTNGTEVRPWVAPAALGRVAWSPRGPFFFEGEGGLMAPLTRYSFYVQQSGMSDPPLHRIPFAAATFHVNAGYRFP